MTKLRRHKGASFDDLIAQLKRRRYELGISQLQLDRYIGTTDGHVAKWESGNRRPTGYLLFCWAQALGLEVQLAQK